MSLPMLVAISITIVVVVTFVLPLLLTFWLWFFHDRHIRRLREDLLNIPARINEEFKGRGATTAGTEPHIKAVQRPIEIELKKKESQRQLFYDRAKLISLFRIK